MSVLKDLLFPRIPKIEAPTVPPPQPPPSVEDTPDPLLIPGSTERLRTQRLGRRRFRANDSLGLPTGNRSGLQIPSGDS